MTAANIKEATTTAPLRTQDKVEEAAVSRRTASPSPSPRRICFVCTGNTCRSPMAAAVFNHLEAKEQASAAAWLGQAGGTPSAPGVPETPSTSNGISNASDIVSPRIALSAGLEAIPGMPITDFAVEALQAAGIPSVPGNAYATHTAQMAERDLLASCDLIVGISRRHAMALLFRYPEWCDRIISMPQDIPDPFGGDRNIYRTCLDALIEGVRALFFQ